MAKETSLLEQKQELRKYSKEYFLLKKWVAEGWIGPYLDKEEYDFFLETKEMYEQNRYLIKSIADELIVMKEELVQCHKELDATKWASSTPRDIGVDLDESGEEEEENEEKEEKRKPKRKRKSKR